MNKMLRLMLCVVMAATVMVGAAFAAGIATEGFTAANDGFTLTFDNGIYTASYQEAGLTGQVSLLVVKGTPERYEITQDTLLYVWVAEPDETGKVTFTFIPKTVINAVVLMGANFADGNSPKVVGTIQAQGVGVSGRVKGYIGTVPPGVALTDGSSTYAATIGTAVIDGGEYVWDFDVSGVPDGIYDLKISKTGHLTATVKGVKVEGADLDLTTSLGTVRLAAGDVNGDGKISSDDLNVVWNADNYFKSVGAEGVDAAADVNGDGTINSDDLNIIWKTENYLKVESDCVINY